MSFLNQNTMSPLLPAPQKDRKGTRKVTERIQSRDEEIFHGGKMNPQMKYDPRL